MQQLSIFDDLLAIAPEVPQEVAQATPVAQAISKAYAPAHDSNYFRLTEDVLAPLCGPSAKVKANIDAIETAIACRKSRMTPTEEQRRTMAAFTGWGGLSEVFAPNSKFSEAQERLKAILTPAEYAQAQDSVLTAYYTEPAVIGAMWQMVRSAGFTGGSVIEPSCGNGHFIGCMPDELRERSHIQMVEIEPLTAAMASAIYSDSRTLVRNCGIEQLVQTSAFDLAIGNVPFGNYRVSDRRLDRLKLPIHEYFVAKALDLVRPGGLVALIVSGSLMDKTQSALKGYMLQKAELLSVVRLPSGVFSRLGGTNVLTDIVLLQKRSAIIPEEQLVEIYRHPIHELAAASDDMYEPKDFPSWRRPPVNRYFAENPTHVLGRFNRQSSRFGETVGVPELASRTEQMDRRIETALAEAANHELAAERVFEHEERLAKAFQRQAEIDEALEIDVDDKSALALSQD